MSKSKRVVLRIFFVGEVVLFGYLLYGSQRGMKEVHILEQKKQKMMHEYKNLKEEIANLESAITQWKTDPFLKEKIARERLHLARAGDTVVYID